jgi:hypothetical protein
LTRPGSNDGVKDAEVAMTIVDTTTRGIAMTTFASSRVKSALFASLSLVISCLFAIGIFGSDTGGALTFHGLISALFGILGMTLLLSFMKPTRLQLEPDGFSHQTLFRRRVWRWEDVSEFQLISLGNSNRRDAARQLSFVGFNEIPTSTNRFARRSRDTIGCDISFKNNFHVPDSELIEILNTWRRRAVAAT